jgi:hypothetical protein
LKLIDNIVVLTNILHYKFIKQNNYFLRRPISKITHPQDEVLSVLERFMDYPEPMRSAINLAYHNQAEKIKKLKYL